ncbi:MAG TPA: glycosyltransferase family 4 protein [Propionibacteriaceae bacterium]
MSSGLRIGLVCPYSFDTPGGVQNHVVGLARHLRDAGHQPYVLAPGELGRAATALDVSHFTTAGSAIPVRYNGSVARVNFGPLSAARVRRWLRSQPFDLLHIHEPITPSIAILALWAAETPVVATFHTATPRSRSMQLAGGAMRASIEKIDAGIAVSESARNVVIQHLGRDSVVIPNGFDFADFAFPLPTVGRWRGGAGPRLVFLGRVDEPRKGFEVLLAAGPLIRERHPDLEVVVAGQGSRMLPSWCRSVGEISDAEKVALLASADVFVAPHLERESFGIVLLEAMASGATVVASDLAPFLDLLGPAPGTDGVALGELFTRGDSAALAAAVNRVLDRRDDDRARRAQQSAKRYDWSLVGPAITTVYEAALAVAGPDHAREEVS